MKSAILGLLSCLCLCAQQAVVEGIALDAVTQMPLAGVHVSLISSGVGTNLAEPDDAYGALSNSAGHYSIGNIRPGTYALEPKHTGYVYVPARNVNATQSITLSAGEQVGGYKIAMTPEATISGRVVDEFGDPVQGVDVKVLSTAEFPPTGLWRMRAQTDDRGEYRISGMPGKYYVEASVHNVQTNGPPEIRTDGSLTSSYATTYHPGSLAKERATPIDAAAGRELTGIDIHVAHRKSLKISGVVTGSHAAGAIVTLRVALDGGEGIDDTTAGADGRFVFVGLAPSDYWVWAAAPSGVPGETLHTPVIQVTVENDDGTVNLPLTTGETMVGTLQVEGDRPGPAVSEQWTVRLTPLDPHGTSTKDGQVRADGSFTISRIVAGKYQPAIDPLPENAYIQSVLIGGVDSGRELDFTKGVANTPMKISVSRNGGQITGMLVDSQDHSLIGRRAFVVLVGDPNNTAAWRGLPSAMDAMFAIHAIAPGKYKLFAIDPLQFGGLRSLDQLKESAVHAQEIEIKEGDRIARDLRLTGRDDAATK